MASKRIEFIDLAKGICMIALVFGHCGVEISGAATLPLYLMISGMFFKEYNSPKIFLAKKANGILTPFLFFYLLGCAAYYGIKAFAPELLITSAGGILDIFNNRQFFNGPIWFVIALFWCSIYFYIIFKITKNKHIRYLICIVAGFIGWWLGNERFFLPMFLDVAMTSLPFFALGYYINKSQMLNKANENAGLAFGILMLVISAILPSRISLHYNIMEGAVSYITGLLIAFGLLFICKKIKSVPFVTFCGRYSLILLCVHHMIYRPLMVLMPKTGIELLGSNWSIATITLLLSAACVPLCKKLIPWFVAQKDLIKLPANNNNYAR